MDLVFHGITTYQKSTIRESRNPGSKVGRRIRERSLGLATDRFNSLNPWHMKVALEEAEKAFSIGEVPVGCVIVDKNNKIISKAHNLKEATNDPCGHAEILAIKKAAKSLGNWRLAGCRMYVTLEPCVMCMGALIQSRVSDLIFGAYDPKGGSISVSQNIHNSKKFNHRISVVGGLLQFESSKMLSQFFRERRTFYQK